MVGLLDLTRHDAGDYCEKYLFLMSKLTEDGKADYDSLNRAYYSSGADDEIVGLTRAQFTIVHPPFMLLFCCLFQRSCAKAVCLSSAIASLICATT